jgi:hypothetical protein
MEIKVPDTLLNTLKSIAGVDEGEGRDMPSMFPKLEKQKGGIMEKGLFDPSKFKILSKTQKLFSKIIDNVKSFASKKTKNISEGISEKFGEMGSYLKSFGASIAMMGIVEPLMPIFESITELLAASLMPITRKLADILIWTIPYIQKFAGWMKIGAEWVSQILTVDFWKGIGKWFEGLGNKFVEWIKNGWNSVVNWFKNLGTKIKNFFVNAWDAVAVWFTQTLPDTILGWFKNIFDDIGRWVKRNINPANWFK